MLVTNVLMFVKLMVEFENDKTNVKFQSQNENH